MAGGSGPSHKGPRVGNREPWALLRVPLQLYNGLFFFNNGLLYVLGACHLETVSAREVSIVAKTAYCLSSVLSSFHIMKFCLTRGNNDHEKMRTSQPALQIRMAVD